MLRPTTLALVLVGLAGCGGGGSFAAGRYADAEASYDVGAPGAGFRRIAVEDQNDLAWASDSLAAVIQVNASCDPALDIPLAALTNHLLIGFTDARDRREELVPLASRQALRTRVWARLDGVPRELELVVLKKDGCVYDFALVAPPGERFARAAPSLEAVVAGFVPGARP